MVIGCDISLNHGGFCWFNEKGKVTDWKFFHNVKKYTVAEPLHGYVFNLKKRSEETSHSFDLRRLVFYRELFHDVVIVEEPDPSWVCGYYSIEGYAIHQGVSSTNRLLQIAELTGSLKELIYHGGGRMRIHDPMSVKMFALHGRATKRDMREAAKQDGFELPDALFKETKKDLDGPGTDVIDAYWLGKMLVMELQLRKGTLLLSDLLPNQIKVFNRVTKSFPVNVLARPFLGDADD
jgi:hypothetical protein